nr:MAG TPA: hypothetical protein [Caudoviricetes sp.]
MHQDPLGNLKAFAIISSSLLDIKMPGHMFALQSVRENDKMHLFKVDFIGIPGKIGSAPVLAHWG